MQAANYAVSKQSVDGIETIRLSDAAHHAEVMVVPSIGNIAYEFKVNGQDVLFSPYHSLAELKARPTLMGVPLLAPWANRLDSDSFFANGQKYLLNPGLDNYKHDGNRQPIHGLLSFTSRWQVVRMHADDKTAEVVSRLEFWRYPEFMAQFPFAHVLEMTYRLSGGALEVRTSIENLAAEAMPLSIAFHPYFQITDMPRDEWSVHLPVKEHYTLSKTLIPTGETQPVESQDVKLAGRQLDDVYGGVEPGAIFSVSGKKQKISVRFGPKYPVAVVYAPPGRGLICFEPMTGITNAFNLNHAGLYPNLQTIPAGGTWSESFWITPSGY